MKNNSRQEKKSNNHQFLKEFDDLLIFKRDNARKSTAILIFSGIIVLCSFLLILVIYANSMNNVIVVSDGGEYLNRSNISAEKLNEVLIKNTCDIVTMRANSFDRLNFQTRIKDLAFYVNTSDLNAIYLKYEADKSYADVIGSGVIYSCRLEDVKEISRMDEQSYRVIFSSVLTVKGISNLKFRIESVGMLTAVTPEYPHNVTGFFFNKLEQSFSKIEEQLN